jgi:iron complex outermembrane recepter protein
MRIRALVVALHCALGLGVAAPRASATAAIVVYTRADLERSGYVRLVDFLSRLPSGSAAQNARYNNGGNGAEQIDLRQLGARYTLVLVDGRRWPTDRHGIVDLSAIPWSDIERIELDPAPSVARHGGGAVAGVVNVVTRRAFRGAEARAWFGEYAAGDGRATYADATLGAGDDATSVVLGVSYDESQPVWARDRAISSVPLYGFGGNDVRAGASSTTPFGRFGVDPGFGAPTLTLISGRPGTAPTDFRPFDPATDGYNFAAETFLTLPSQRANLSTHASRSLAPGIAGSIDVSWSERRARRRLAPMPLAFSGIGAEPVVAADSVYNPFGVAVRRWQYRNTVAPRTFANDATTFRVNAALAGTFAAATGDVDWEVSWVHGETDAREVARGQFSAQRLAQGLGPSFRGDNGVPTCGRPSAPIANCVPVDVFSGPDSFTPAMAAYAGVELESTAQDILDDAAVTLATSLPGWLPGRPVALSVGASHRRLSARSTPDALAESGGVAGAPSPITAGPDPLRGSTATTELFATLDIPVLADRPFARSLDVSLGWRGAHFSRKGAPRAARYDAGTPVLPRREPDETGSAPHFAFRWQPFAEWQLVGTWSRGYVEPALAQLFEGQRNTFPTLFDPCSAGALPPPENEPGNVVRRRCERGIGGVAPVPRNAQFPYDNPAWTFGGNPRLDPETTEQRHLGVSWAPRDLADFRVSVDWHRTRIDDRAAIRSATGTLFDCYIAGDLDACANITRVPGDGTVSRLYVGWRNVASIASESYDLSLDRRWTTDQGSIGLRWRASYLAYLGDAGREPAGTCVGQVVAGQVEYCASLASGNLVGNHRGAGSALHRVRSRIELDWQHGSWTLATTARWLSALDASCAEPVALGRPERCTRLVANDPAFFGPSQRLPATWYVDLHGSWNTPWNASVTLGVRNATDRDPPVSYSAFAGNFDSEYEVPGRFWYAGYVQRF